MIIIVGGDRSEIGKTTLVCEICRILPRLLAVKCSLSEKHDEDLLVLDERILREAGKDTARYFEAGADEVILLKGTAKGLPKLVEKLKPHLERAHHIVLEGNRIASFVDADLVLFVEDGECGEKKETAAPLRARAHLVLRGGDMDFELVAKKIEEIV